MVNTQDPLLSFPASVSFAPYAYFRNVSATPKTLQFVVYYMDGRTVKSLPLADLTLQPGQAQGPDGGGDGVAKRAGILMQADTLELGGLAVDEQAVVGIELELADAEGRDDFVKRLAVER